MVFRISYVMIFLGSVFGRTHFCGFLFLGRRIFSRILSPDFFSSFLWDKCPRKILQENHRQKPPKLTQQNPRHISTRGRAKISKKNGTPYKFRGSKIQPLKLNAAECLKPLVLQCFFEGSSLNLRGEASPTNFRGGWAYTVQQGLVLLPRHI